MEPMRIAAGMPVFDRLLWFLAWNRRPLYVVAGALALIGALFTHSLFGFLLALLPLAALYKANQIVNAASPQIIESAKAAALKAGTQRVGVELENSDHVALLIPEKSGSPFGIRPAPRYTLSCVYITDAFFAVFPGSSFSLPTRALTPAATAEEIYFRHVSAINQRDGYIEITLNPATSRSASISETTRTRCAFSIPCERGSDRLARLPNSQFPRRLLTKPRQSSRHR
jgi:hypothetical protein